MVEEAKQDFESKIDVKVPLVELYLSGMPFALKSRRGVAIVLSFFGDVDEVGELMQKSSHETRAYFVNANGLKGFIKSVIVTFLRKAEEKGELKGALQHKIEMGATEHHEVKIKALFADLDDMPTDKERINYLESKYPYLFILVL